MAKLNNLYYQSVVFWDWQELQYSIEKELSHEGLTINEVERIEDDILVTFEIKDKEEEVLNHLKQYCNNIAEYKELLDYVDEGSGEIIKNVVLNILTKILKEKDSRIKVLDIKASYHGVLIRFDFEEPLVKTAVYTIERETVFKDMKSLLSKVTDNLNESYLESKIEDAIQQEAQLDFIVEDVLNNYMNLHFSNYSIDILDGDDFDKSIVSIAIGC